MDAYYVTLNLDPQASLQEIKCSYRQLAKRYHPDVAEDGVGDVHKFHKINQAYHSLLNEIKDAVGEDIKVDARESHRPADKHRPDENHPHREKGAPPVRPKPKPRRSWRFEGVTENGSDVIYVLRVTRNAAKNGLDIVLPWKAEDACPSCLGLGHTLKPIFGGPHMVRVECLKCQTKGVVKYNSSVRVELTPDIISQGKVVMQGLGHYNPRTAVRGNLIVEIMVDPGRRNQVGGMYSA